MDLKTNKSQNDTETMTIHEIARAIEWVRAKGMIYKDACDLLRYIAGRNETGSAT